MLARTLVEWVRPRLRLVTKLSLESNGSSVASHWNTGVLNPGSRWVLRHDQLTRLGLISRNRAHEIEDGRESKHVNSWTLTFGVEKVRGGVDPEVCKAFSRPVSEGGKIVPRISALYPH